MPVAAQDASKLPSRKKSRARPTHPGFPRHFFRTVYEDLSDALGPSHWWPARTPFEVMVGAVLTQNTNWKNVERAVAALRDNQLLRPRRMHARPVAELAPIIRSSGYYNQKAIKLHALLDWFEGYGYSVARVRKAFPPGHRDALRTEMLTIRGLGPETVDSILAYAFELPYFTVDAYTLRWLRRYRPERATRDYETVRAAVETEFRRDAPDETGLVHELQEMHALLVRLCSNTCRKRNPNCPECPLQRKCARHLE